MKLKIFSTNNMSLIVNEFLTLDRFFELTDDTSIADIALVVIQTNTISFIEKLLYRYSNLKIITDMISHDFNSNRVYMLNLKMRDPFINTLVNNVFGLKISHIDITLVYHDLNLKSEVMNALCVVGMIFGWDNYKNELTLRFSYNDMSVHVSGYSRKLNFTLSIFISNNGEYNTFNETINVFSIDNGIFVLDNDYHQHSYYERYGSAMQTVLIDAINNNWYYQYRIPLIVTSSISSTKRVIIPDI